MNSSISAVVLVFALLFSLLYISNVIPERPKVAIVIIPEGASLADSEHNFEPAVITVVIGVNNTVRWVNQDVTFSTIKADNMSDQEFWKATNLDESSNADQSLSPGETFEFTFTKPGQFGYHSEPHPHLRGTVIVLSGSEK